METQQIKIYSLICSRDNNFKQVTKDLFTRLHKEDIEVKCLVGFNSIFEAYYQGFKQLNANPDDIIILCHDDIEIYDYPSIRSLLTESLIDNVGFVGVAGTTTLNTDAVWWDWYSPKNMRGSVWHGTKTKKHVTTFGDYGDVAVLDGLFLACRASTLTRISMIKPTQFEGLWDFYDLYYTIQASLLGFTNKVVPINIRHESFGELAGRESWHKNRKSFIDLFKEYLPYKI